MSSFVERELAVIAALDAAIATEQRPDYAVFLRDAKDEHQTALGQVAALQRLDGGSTAGSAGLAGTLQSLQVRLTQLVGAPLTFRALRVVEMHLSELYEAERSTSSGLKRDALTKILERAQQRICLLTAHIVKNARGATDERSPLPRPLSDYFAGDESRACMRCLVDRPGSHAAISRSDPTTYVCAACHDEVRASFPADIAAQMVAWPETALLDRVVEKALSRPSKETAKKRVHRFLSGQEPTVAPAPRGFVASPAPGGARSHDPAAADAALTLDRDLGAATPAEAEYSRTLFDGVSIRSSW